MHYVGMIAMKGPFRRIWSFYYLAASVFFGVVICFVGFWILFRPLHWKVEKSWYRQASAAVIALAICFLHFFGMYWLIITLNNFNDFVCAAVTVNYYFKTDIKNIRIFCHSLGHNVGSIAWSIVLLPTMLIKLIFGAFDYLLTSDNPNGC